MFAKILVANRGEIAVRAFRAATELGARTVAVFPHEDRTLRAPAQGRRVVPDRRGGPPGPGLPRPREHRAGGRRVRRRRDLPGLRLPLREPAARRGVRGQRHHLHRPAGLRAAPGRQQVTGHHGGPRGRAADPATAPSPTTDLDALAAAAEGIGFPVFVKAVSGGGGRGMRRVDDPSTLRESLEAAQREADAAFGDPTLYLEQAVVNPRHIEVQVLADSTGTVLHLFERDCSVQRRHQKVVEIAPAPNLDPAHPRPDVRGCRALRRVDRLPQRGHGRVPPRRGRPLRLHRDEPAHPGRAHRHRGGHRRRPRRRPDADRRRARRSTTSTCARTTSTCAAPPCSAASPPRTPPTASARMPARSPSTARPAAAGCASTVARCSSGPRSAPTSTRCSSSSPAAGAPSRWPCAGPDGRWRSSGSVASRRTSRSSRRCWPTPCSSTARRRRASSTSGPSCSRPGWAATAAPSCSPTSPTSRSTSRTGRPRPTSSPRTKLPAIDRDAPAAPAATATC